MFEENKYVKVVYQSNPIGKEQIILYLTTFDIEAFEKDQSLEKIPTKKIAKAFDIPEKIIGDGTAFGVNYNMYQAELFETIIEKFIAETYDEELRKMQCCIEALRKIKIVPQWNTKNITNSDDVHCNIVEGNISNCDNVYCNEIKGNVVNCDNVIYKNKEEK